jgi:signal peptidase I
MADNEKKHSIFSGKLNYDMSDKKKSLNMKVQWTKFGIVLALYFLFLFWVKSWLGLIVVPFIYDVYISKKIR